ncbi:hypothetical protein JCM8208_002085, partial [Rhodotorula glutinis]
MEACTKSQGSSGAPHLGSRRGSYTGYAVKKQNTAVIDGGNGGHYKRGFNDNDGLFS